MIYLLIIGVIMTLFGFVRRMRLSSFRTVALDILIAAVFGWIAGVFIGIGARIGMWSIPFFNGTESRFTIGGTFDVILLFSLYGIGLGILYELIFRDLLRKSGLLFGALLTLCTWYPLGNAGVQQLNFSPVILPLVLFSGLIIGLMFVPFGVVLELLLGRWHMAATKRFRFEGLPS